MPMSLEFTQLPYTALPRFLSLYRPLGSIHLCWIPGELRGRRCGCQ